MSHISFTEFRANMASHLDQLEAEPGNTLLLAIQDLDAELRGVLLVHEKDDTLIVGNRLDELE